jgi:integrase
MLSPRTVRAYRSDWQAFCKWASARRLPTLPADPSTLALYIVQASGAAKASTLARRLAAIANAHRAHGLASPTEHPSVKEAWARVRREAAGVVERARPIGVPLLRHMVESLPSGLGGTRDRALLLLGFAGAMRRSDLVAIDVEDVVRLDEGLVVVHGAPDANGDAAATGMAVGIPIGLHPTTCPARAVDDWCCEAGVSSHALFRPVSRTGRVGLARLNPAAVTRVVQKAVAAAGLDPRRYSAQSLRAGFVAAARFAGVPEEDIVTHLRGRSLGPARDSAASRLLGDSAAASVGL